MKKLLAAISILCYLVVTCGVNVNFHYCMNRLASTELFAAKADRCGQCGMDMHESNDCCRDEVKIVKLQNDQQKNIVASFDLPSITSLHTVPSVYIETSFFNVNTERHFHNHSPPLLSEQDVYLQNNVFRI